MAPRDVSTTEKGEQKTQILFLKKINAEPPPNSSQVKKGIRWSLFKASWRGKTHVSTRVQTHAPTCVSPTREDDPTDARIPDAHRPGAREQLLGCPHPDARAHDP